MSDLFNSCGRDIVESILLRCDPNSVLTICSLNRRLFNISRDQDLFRRLLTAHYPNSFHTENPKKQYVAICRGAETVYIMNRLKLSKTVAFSRPLLLVEPCFPELTPGWSIENMALHQLAPIINDLQTSNRLDNDVDRKIYEEIVSRYTIYSKTLESLKVNNESKKEKRNLASVLDFILKKHLARFRECGDAIPPLWKSHLLQQCKSRQFQSNGDKYIILTIPGCPIPKGNEIWFRIWCYKSCVISGDDITVHRTKDDLCRDFVDKNYDGFVNDLLKACDNRLNLIPIYHMVDGYYGEPADRRIKHAIFAEFMQSSGIVPKDYTKENLYNHCMREAIFRYQLFPDINRVMHIFHYTV